MKRPARTDPDDPILHAVEAAKYLRVSRSTLRRMVRTRSIKFSRIGRVLKFRKSDLDAMVADNLGDEVMEGALDLLLHPRGGAA